MKEYFSVFREDDGIYRIWENKSGGVSEFIITGNEKALLIDTGYGIHDLKKFIEDNITSLPLTVANSHYHPDHSAGNGSFEKVYIGEMDIPGDTPSDFESLTAKLSSALPPLGKLINKIFPPFDDKNVEYVPISEGFIFDLGGRTVTVHDFPGHTKGSVMFSDAKTSSLFTGDCINSNTWLFTNPELKLNDYISFAGRLNEAFADIKKVYYSHTKAVTGTEFFTEYVEFLKKIKSAKKIKIKLPGIKDTLCIAFGKLPKFGFSTVFIFKNQI